MENIKELYLLKNQVSILYSQASITFAFPLIFGLLLCYFLSGLVENHNLFIWTLILFLFTISRYYLLWIYRKRQVTAENVSTWLFIFIAGVFISGLLWGLAPVLLVPYSLENLLTYTLYNGLIILLICGLVTGAGITYSVNLLVMYSYSLPALLLPAMYLVTLGDHLTSILGCFIFIYFIFINFSVLRLNKQYKYFLQLEYKYELMSARLHLLEQQQHACS